MQINFKFEDEAIQASLKKLRDLGRDMTPITQAITAVLESESANAFIKEQNPADGKKWEAHSERYQAHLAKKGITKSKILQRSGLLARSLSTEFDAVSAVIGTNRVYGALHQRGGMPTLSPSVRDMPARPYMGLSKDGIADINEIISKQLQKTFKE